MDGVIAVSRVTHDLSRMSTVVLQGLLRLPQIGEPYKAKIKAVLNGRPDKERRRSKRSQDLRPEVSAIVNPDGSLVLVLRPEPPSANDIKRWLYHPRCKHHYATYKKALARLFSSPPAHGHSVAGAVHVTHYWRLTGEPRDQDSFGLSLKPVLDAMVTAGLIEDDRNVELELGGQECGGDGSYTDRSLTLVVRPLTKGES